MTNLKRYGIWALLTVYAVLGLTTMLVNPLLESPDELLNYENMRAIVENKRLPVLQPGEMSKAHHPPLYYLIGAAVTGRIPAENLEAMGQNINKFFGFRTYDFGIDNKSQYLHNSPAEAWPWHDAALGLYLMRLLSIVFGAGGILAVYKIGRTLFTEEAPALLAAAFVGLNPMYVYIQSSVHNDALTNLLAACTIWSLVVYWQKPSLKQAVIIGVVAALGILTKITFLFMGPVVLVVIIGRHLFLRQDDPSWWQNLAKNLILAGAIVVVVAGWWFVRNQILYGEPTSMQLQASIWQPRPNAPDWDAAVRELSYLRDSFWGAFGFGQIVFPRLVYQIMNSVVVLALVGLIAWAVKFSKMGLANPTHRWLLGLLLVSPLTAFGATFSRMSISGTANFGRYLFTSYGVLAPLLALGLFSLMRLLTKGKKSADMPFAILLTTGLIGLNLYAIFGVIRPVFAPPPVFATADQVAPQFPLEVEFSNGPKLLGYSLESDSVIPDEPFAVTLFWQGASRGTDENFVEFVQLVTHHGDRIAGRDTLHGLGRYPTSNWRPGEVVVDRVPLYLPDYLNFGPIGFSLNIGLKDGFGEAVPLQNGDTTFTLGTVRLAPVETADLEPAIYQFGDAINLIQLDELPEVVTADEYFQLALKWQSVAPVPDDYVVLVHLVLAGEVEPVAQFDGAPDYNRFPTRLWQPNDVISDMRLLNTPVDLPPGDYEILIGLYRLSDFARLPVTDPAGTSYPNNAVSIGTITVK